MGNIRYDVRFIDTSAVALVRGGSLVPLGEAEVSEGQEISSKFKKPELEFERVAIYDSRPVRPFNYAAGGSCLF